MKKNLIIPVIFGLIAIILLVILVPLIQNPVTPTDTFVPIVKNTIPTREVLTKTNASSVIDFSYVESNSLLKSSLALNKISMSNPLKISGDSITKYCTFFENDDRQKEIHYCTSTELKDPEGKFLGNIHIVGDVDSPRAVLGVIQTDPFMSNLNYIKSTYQIMVESLVCVCWQDQNPGDLESVSAWIDAVKTHHLEAIHTTSNSQIDGLTQKHLLLEVTTNTEGYLWKFIITN